MDNQVTQIIFTLVIFHKQSANRKKNFTKKFTENIIKKQFIPLQLKFLLLIIIHLKTLFKI